MPRIDWKKIVGTVGGTLSSALGGPLAGMAVGRIADALGIERTGTLEAVEKRVEQAVLVASPEQLAHLKEADQAFAAEMKKLDIDLFEIETRDVQDARSKTFGHWVTTTIALVVVTGTFVLMGVLLSGWAVVADNMETFVGMAVGAVMSAFIAVINYHFGSSAGSKQKTEQLARMK